MNFRAFEKDYDEVIKSAFEAGVTKIINVGTKIDSSQKAVELAQKYENLYAVLGVHPHHADKPLLGCHPEFISGSLAMKNYFTYILASNSKVLYVGMTENLSRRIFEHKQGFSRGIHKKI